MKIESMRLFAEVVKHGSFSRAAEHLDVSKGYLSQQLKQLEKALGKQLLVRNTRTMRLTSAGEILYEQAFRLTTFWADAQALLETGEDQRQGRVKCTAPVGLAHHVLWPLFREVLDAEPGISLSVHSGNTTHNLIRDHFDFAVRISNAPPEDMIARQLYRFPYIACATPEFTARHGLPDTPGALSKFDCLALVHWANWTFYRDDESQSIDIDARFAASDNEILKQACLEHRGIARLPAYMIENELASGRLRPVFDDYRGEERGVYLLYPQMSSRPARVKIFLDKLMNTYS